MKCIAEREVLRNTYTNVRNFSFEEKRSELFDEEKINAFLDAINRFKKDINHKNRKD